MRPPTRRSLIAAALAANLLVLVDVSLTYAALSDPGIPVAEGDPATAAMIGALGLAGGLALDALVRIALFTSLLVYVYRRALVRPRVVPLYWGAAAALVVINGAVVLSNLFVLWTVPHIPPATWRGPR